MQGHRRRFTEGPAEGHGKMAWIRESPPRGDGGDGAAGWSCDLQGFAHLLQSPGLHVGHWCGVEVEAEGLVEGAGLDADHRADPFDCEGVGEMGLNELPGSPDCLLAGWYRHIADGSDRTMLPRREVEKHRQKGVLQFRQQQRGAQCGWLGLHLPVEEQHIVQKASACSSIQANLMTVWESNSGFFTIQLTGLIQQRLGFNDNNHDVDRCPVKTRPSQANLSSTGSPFLARKPFAPGR